VGLRVDHRHHQHEEHLLGGIGRRRDGVGREDGERGGLAQALVLFLRARERLAHEEAFEG
jgi:hypothetical protein